MGKRRSGNQKKVKNHSKSQEENNYNIERELLSYFLILIVGVILALHLNVVVSGSMEPVFYRGDVVIIENTNFLGFNEIDAESIKVGDIIIYDATWFSEPVIHRIISIQQGPDGKKYFVTKGDNNSNADPGLVSVEQIRARVVTIGNQPMVIPKIGYITLVIRGL